MVEYGFRGLIMAGFADMRQRAVWGARAFGVAPQLVNSHGGVCEIENAGGEVLFGEGARQSASSFVDSRHRDGVAHLALSVRAESPLEWC